MKPVFEYLDFRLFLKDVYLKGKAEVPPISYRSLAQKLGFTSPNFLKLVIDGQRNLGRESREKICRGLGLGKQESEYFECLIGFNQSRRSSEKQAFFQRLSRFSKISGTAKVQAERFAFYREWYHPVVRELLEGESQPLDYAKLGGKVVPPLTSRQVLHSARLLEKLGLIHVGEDARYHQTDRFLSTETQIQSLAVRDYHKTMLELAVRALEGCPLDRREISSLTVKISHPCFQDLRRMILEFKNRVMERVQEDTCAERVYQMNFQFFPLSRIGES